MAWPGRSAMSTSTGLRTRGPSADTVRVGAIDVRPAAPAHPGYEPLKRALDVLGGSVLLLLSLPILLTAMAAVLVTSGRPIFFGQRRMGYLGQEFICWKVRTMVPDAERRRDEVVHLNTTGGPAFKLPNDPRLTPVGSFLRKFSIDEIPQFWNIVRGDMSLVGPRALPIVENEYTGRQAERLSVKPGLTCIWQISGRSQVTFEQWMQMDLDYVARRSLWFDLLLLLKTPMAVLSRRGAM
ncbi:MAG: hypothetical protein GEU80_07710 [Dehalococcoidia bacterium]|nr:hypothetical protein [Dehalococcoidia bacterium]